MPLICKKCGYKQHDDGTILSAKISFPGMPEHDIPYYCGACMDTASDEEYDVMMKETAGEENPKLIVIQTYRGLVDSVFANIELPEGTKIVIQDVEEDLPLIPTDEMKQL